MGAGVCGEEARRQQHVVIDEQQDVAARGSHAGVAGRAAIGLRDEQRLHVESPPGRRAHDRLGTVRRAVVDHDRSRTAGASRCASRAASAAFQERRAIFVAMTTENFTPRPLEQRAGHALGRTHVIGVERAQPLATRAPAPRRHQRRQPRARRPPPGMSVPRSSGISISPASMFGWAVSGKRAVDRDDHRAFQGRSHERQRDRGIAAAR
jgi:hypothetical protein